MNVKFQGSKNHTNTVSMNCIGLKMRLILLSSLLLLGILLANGKLSDSDEESNNFNPMFENGEGA